MIWPDWLLFRSLRCLHLQYVLPMRPLRPVVPTDCFVAKSTEPAVRLRARTMRLSLVSGRGAMDVRRKSMNAEGSDHFATIHEPKLVIPALPLLSSTRLISSSNLFISVSLSTSLCQS